MKLLLYCTKAKPMLKVAKEDLFKPHDRARCYKQEEIKYFTKYVSEEMYEANGKIIAECDFEVERIKYLCTCKDGNAYATDKFCLNLEELCKASCLSSSSNELDSYLGNKDGYAIHIKNLHIFDVPKELSDYYKIEDVGGMLFTKPLTKAPQNMIRVSVNHWDYATYEPNDIKRLISIKPEELCKILNGEKTIEVRKNV